MTSSVIVSKAIKSTHSIYSLACVSVCDESNWSTFSDGRLLHEIVHILIDIWALCSLLCFDVAHAIYGTMRKLFGEKVAEPENLSLSPCCVPGLEFFVWDGEDAGVDVSVIPPYYTMNRMIQTALWPDLPVCR